MNALARARMSLLQRSLLAIVIVSAVGALAFAAGPQDNSQKYDLFLRRVRVESKTKSHLLSLSKTHAINAETQTVGVMIKVLSGTHAPDVLAVDPRISVVTESNGILTAQIPIDALDKVA